MRLTRIQQGGAMVAAIALCFAGCARRNTYSSNVGAGGDTTMGAPTANSDSSSANAPMGAAANYTDANIAALLDEANAADSAAGAFVASKTTNKDVKDFANDMMKDHHDLRQKGQDLVQKKNMTPQPPSKDPVQDASKQEMDALQNAQGAQLDKTYIDNEVQIHQAVIALAKQFQNQAQDPDLPKLIGDALPTLQKHMDKSMKLQQKLSNPTTS